MQHAELIAAGHRLHSHMKIRHKMQKRLNKVIDIFDVKVPGMNYLGNGAYGVAYECEGHVIKYSAHDVTNRRYWPRQEKPSCDAWQVYAEFCAYHRSPHLPNIIHFERVSEHCAWAIMPKYEPLQEEQAEIDLCKISRNLRNMQSGSGVSEEFAWMWQLKPLMDEHYLNVDCHRGNVMVDPKEGTLVLTDPFC